jgi:putative lipoprotein (rSAM/lipoprotein system)
MKKLLLKFFAFILGLFGVSCFGPAVMYGAPTASYKLSGNVIDKETNLAIQNIELDFYYTKVYSDSKGDWQINVGGYSPCSNCIIVVRDVDGEENGGQFVEQVVNVNPVKTQDGKGFYMGTFEQHNIKIEMEKSPIPLDNND